MSFLRDLSLPYLQQKKLWGRLTLQSGYWSRFGVLDSFGGRKWVDLSAQTAHFCIIFYLTMYVSFHVHSSFLFSFCLYFFNEPFLQGSWASFLSNRRLGSMGALSVLSLIYDFLWGRCMLRFTFGLSASTFYQFLSAWISSREVCFLRWRHFLFLGWWDWCTFSPLKCNDYQSRLIFSPIMVKNNSICNALHMLCNNLFLIESSLFFLWNKSYYTWS